MLGNLDKYKIILGSNSPRRRELLEKLEINFTVMQSQLADESYPNELFAEDIPMYLAEKKSDSLPELLLNELLITSDTIVWQNNEVLGKPINYPDAFQMLMRLSGKTHEVITGVHVRSSQKRHTFFVSSKVTFATISQEEIRHYIETYRPYDKAGAYGIQEWIGFIGIDKIEGSYNNVVGLPTQKLYQVLKQF